MADTRPLLSATLIARNEKHNLKACLDSLWDHVDEVVIVDTGSTDGTLAAARRYAQKRKQPQKLITASFDWRDDFAAARQAADELARGEWLVWCDLDDTVQGLDRLRQMAADATSDVVAFFVRYRYAADQDGNPISELWRERVVRNDGTRWSGRLHEHKLFTHGQIVQVDPQTAEWVHRRDHTERSGERNLRILEQWLADEPASPRVIQSIAMEYLGQDRHQDAADMFARYLQCEGEQPDRRAQAARHMCVSLMVQDRPHDARAAAYRALEETPAWPDTHLTLAEAEQTLGHPDLAILHCETVLRLGKPSTLLIINPTQYTAHPHAIMGVCYAQLGRFDEATRHLDEALRIAPSYQLALAQQPVVRGAQRREHAVASWLACTEVLLETGELLKAASLLRTAPWYVSQDPRIVRRRIDVARLTGRRQLEPAALVEDPDADAFVARHLEAA